MAEIIGHMSEQVSVIIVFHNVNSISYTVTNIYPNAWILLKVSYLSLVETVLFTVTSMRSIQKSMKKNPENSKKIKDNRKIQGSSRSKDREIKLKKKKEI